MERVLDDFLKPGDLAGATEAGIINHDDNRDDNFLISSAKEAYSLKYKKFRSQILGFNILVNFADYQCGFL